MSVMITADLHLSENPRDAYRHEWVDGWLIHEIDRRAVNLLLILGDLTQDKDRHGAWLVNRVVKHLHDLSAGGCTVMLLRGNHDYIDPAFPFYAFVDKLPNVAWINKPTLLELPGITGRAIALPHVADPTGEWAKLKLDQYEWIFAHQTFEGANAGHNVELKGPSVDILPPKAAVISGDVHVPQSLGNVVYVGAPYRVNFGDDYRPRVLLINDDGSIKSIKTAGPQKRLVTISEISELEEAEVNRGDIVKVRVELDAGEATLWSAMRKEIVAWAEQAGVTLHLVQLLQSQPTIKSRAGRRWANDEQLLGEYATRTGLKAPVVKAGLKLMRKA